MTGVSFDFVCHPVGDGPLIRGPVTIVILLAIKAGRVSCKGTHDIVLSRLGCVFGVVADTGSTYFGVRNLLEEWKTFLRSCNTDRPNLSVASDQKKRKFRIVRGLGR
ncbi:MAG: hypothetical protein JRF52_11100 [Deltaproteobacteria bacterium]|nr:hypothetical protein [Deltaproteobacteria bacterium]